MTSIAQVNENEQREIRGSLKKFIAEYHLSGLLKMCRVEKQKLRFSSLPYTDPVNRKERPPSI